MQPNDKLRFPIGTFAKPDTITSAQLATWIEEIASFPERLRKEVLQLSDSQLDTPYRPEGWTLRQVVHHCADSHLNSYIRFKLSLTEENPTIKPYEEQLWAALLQSLDEQQLLRTFFHPKYEKTYSLNEAIGLYAWHGNHHLAHITTLKAQKDW
ncbi:hypothetical protein SAMN05421780_10922 [Flexibacter flexilis DSM 6793]|uniref:DinB-like domain-containing protein n=1 Tax=Flexibacter flexilis DSM 6793 TaxID=927664 RepID=A0A1I1LU50_9BACT|nr:metal-dependent hydrolase [Flexibacter flexilis]SFC73823.1 hypothetical protein SAMN05421780_10922 [Flexibacter flexilis DSM 6793]